MNSYSTEQVQQPWRIGTYSMGITLIGIGLAFAASLWQSTSSYELLLWLAPIVFIVLGGELLLAYSKRMTTKYRVEFNWLGVFFVGCVGAGALILSAFLSSGILDGINQVFNMKERSFYVEEKVEYIDPAVNKIVIRSEIDFEIQTQANLKEVSLLGLIRYEAKEPLKQEQTIMKSKQVGSVLYVFIQNIENGSTPFASSYTRSQLVLTVPDSLIIED